MGFYVVDLVYKEFDDKLSEIEKIEEREVWIIFEEFILVIFICFIIM